MDPLALPRDLVTGIRSLREIADDLAHVRAHTAHLPPMNDGVATIAHDAHVLPEVERTLHQMDERLAAVETALQVLVELERHMSALQETLAPVGRIAGRIPGGARRT